MNGYLGVNEFEVIAKHTNEKKSVDIKDCIYLIAKRGIDILSGIVGLCIMIPLIILIKVASIITGDNNTIFFTQTRIGKGGKEFKIYKFRTMVVGAENLLVSMIDKNEEIKKEYELNRKIESDSRITKIGKFLRNTSLDEVPQFINVLKGDMTLIGNRPYMVSEKLDIGRSYSQIIKTKPGLTGLWQVSGRSERTFQQRVRLEKFYSNNYSTKFDIEILIKTFLAVFKGHGAK